MAIAFTVRQKNQNQKQKFFAATLIASSVGFLFGSADPARASEGGGLKYTSVDVMKWTKDMVANQPSDSEIDGIVSAIVTTIKPQYIAVSVPLDTTSDYPVGHSPSPRSAEAFTQAWSDAIHRRGLLVLWRGTWSGLEGLYNFQKRVGGNRFPTGTAHSAPTDGETTWLGKTYAYILTHPSAFSDGDLWAPLPERTEGVFSDESAFISGSGAGLQANYAQFFNDLKKVSDAAFAAINKRVTTGLSAQNYSEVASGWLPQTVLDAAGYIAVDYYGVTHTPEEMESDLRKIHRERGKALFLQEWGDYWHPALDSGERYRYVESMYAMWRRLVEEGILIGFNYWGAWGGNQEGILDTAGEGRFSVNSRGRQLAAFFAGVSPATAGAAPVQSIEVSASPQAVIGGSSPSPAVSGSVTAPRVILPQNVRDGEAIKFASSPTVYVVKPEGLYPFSTWKSFELYSRSTGRALHYRLEPAEFFTIKGELAPAAIARSAPSYPSGALVNERGTIYFVRGSTKIPFTNLQAFLELGYALDGVISGDLSSYAPAGEQISVAADGHPWGSWILAGQTVYYTHPRGLIGVPDWETFLSNGGQANFIAPATAADLTHPGQGNMLATDERVYR